MKQNYIRNLITRNLELNWQTFLVFILFTTVGFGSMKGQVSAYTFSQSNGTFSSISGGSVLGVATGNTTTTNLNSNVYPVTIPFAFNFNGQNYTSLNVSTNGFITFGTTPPAATLTAPISGATAYDGAIAAFGHSISSFYDVLGKTGDISWTTLGAAPNREVVIQWTNFRPTSTTVTTSVYALSFQIRLQETTNKVSVVYSGGSYLVGSTAYSSAVNQVGLRGASNADFNNRFNAATTPYENSIAGDANGDDQAFSTVNAIPGMPSDGLTYTWTPPTCYAPTTISTGLITTTSAEINWVAPLQVPAVGYDVYFNTTGIAPDGTTVLDATNSVTVGSTAVSATLNSLSSSTQYFVWIRGKCSPTDNSKWSMETLFNTACVPLNVPYTQNFDTTAVGTSTNNNAPACWSYLETSGSAGYGYVANSANSNSAPNSFYMNNSSDITGDIMLVSPQTTNLSSGTNRVRFFAKGTVAGYPLEIGTLSNSSDPTTFTIIGSPIILTTTQTEYTVNIPVGTNANLAFRHGMNSTSDIIYIDDIVVEAMPTCVEPTALQVTAGSITSTGGNLTWTSAITPATGYEIYYSTSNTAPTATTVLDATNSVAVSGTTATLAGLTPSTTYYIWIRSVCSSTDKSIWTIDPITLNTLCLPPAITGTTSSTSGTPMCKNDVATLTATSDAGATINWYANATGGSVVGTGPSFTTPPLLASTNYYVSASVGGTQSGALANATSTSGYTLEAGLFFDATSTFTLQGVNVYPIGTGVGDVVISLQDGNVSPAVTLQTITVSLTGTTAPYVKTYVPLNFTITPGTNYKLMMMSRSGGVASLVRESGSSWGTYPLTVPSVMSITNGNCCSGNTTSTSYYYFYDWQLSSKCESARTAVAVDVDQTCDILGTNEINSEKNISIYPNPFTDVINISDIKNVVSVSITDLSGRIVKTIAKPTTKLYLGELQSGMYLITLKYKDGSVTTLKAIKK